MTKYKEIIETEKRNGRFSGSINLNEFSEKPNFSGSINAKELNEINISYNPEYEKQNNKEKTGEIIKDIVRHEINHKGYSGFKGCPRNIENHVEKIFEPVSEVLLEKGFNKNDCHYVSNALEDTILHDDLSSKFNLNGISYFFEDVGKNSHDLTDFYEAHIKLNLFLFGSKKHKKLLGKFFKNSKEVKEVLINFLKKSGISNIQDNLADEIKQVYNKSEIRNFLNNEENWKKISKVYAEEFSKLMKPDYAMPLLNHSGKGTSSGIKDKNQSEEDQSESQSEISEYQEGNEFDKEMNSKEFKEQRIKKAYESSQGMPEWMDYFDALDLLYSNLAKKLNIKVETFTHASQYPIFYYGKRDFDPEKDNLKKVSFGFNDNGSVKLIKKRYDEKIPWEYKFNPKGFPEIKFCFMDTSKSMEDPIKGSDIGKTNIIPWGDNSKYHYAVLAWKGFLEYLKQNHLLNKESVSLLNYSDRSYLAKGLEESKRLAFKPQFGNTIITPSKLKETFSGQGNLILNISDGQINNWSEIENIFLEGAKKHYYFHLQLGPHTDQTKKMIQSGLYVETIKNPTDLATKVIDLTDKIYRTQVN